MEKTIKINYAGFHQYLNKTDNVFYNVLKERYQLEISDTPDYLFCSMLGKPYEMCTYDCVRIFFSGENYSPDFTLVDYAIGTDYISFEDRYLRYPLFLMFPQINDANKKHLYANESIITKKPYFCNFIYGNSNAQRYRTDLFNALCKYKMVSSTGTLLHNMGSTVTPDYKSKLEFQKQCKFSIVVESTSYNGFISEKILHAFAANTIPIYYGDPLIARQFNPKSFINCHEYETIDDVIKAIKDIDNDDKKYISMLKEPMFLDEHYVEKQYSNLKEFLFNIFDQRLEDAYRRPRMFIPIQHNNHLKAFYKMYKALYLPRKIIKKL